MTGGGSWRSFARSSNRGRSWSIGVGEAPPIDPTMAEDADEGSGGLALQPRPAEIAMEPTAATPEPRTQQVDVGPLTRSKLRRLLATLDELTPADLARRAR